MIVGIHYGHKVTGEYKITCDTEDFCIKCDIRFMCYTKNTIYIQRSVLEQEFFHCSVGKHRNKTLGIPNKVETVIEREKE